MDVRFFVAWAHAASARRSIVVALMTVACAVAAAVQAVPAGAAQSCAMRIFRDWSDNHRIDRVYGLRCYRAAIKALPVDVRTYSSAEDDIRRAMLYAQSDKSDPGDKGSGSTPEAPATTPAGQAASASAPSRGPDDVTRPSPRTKNATAVERPPRADVDTPTSAAGTDVARVEEASLPIPLPLIGLAAVSALLLVFGSIGYLTRRFASHLHGS
jgi:hypothetical protein